ncbi:tagatose 3-epimerase [Bacilli bacterium]|nr:tagatose 3-epimerase [Bacilli bacterium]
MKFGLCASLEHLPLAERLGFDYIECSVSSIEALGDEEFAAAVTRVNKNSLAAERVNVLFPGSIQLIGPAADQKKIDAYLEKALSRVKALGASLVVFGSGRCRAIPAALSFRQGYGELVRVTRRIGEIAAGFGLTIAIEPLNREETNCINSLREGAMLQAVVDSASVGLLADLYHMGREYEPMENILAVKELNHTHIALPKDRAYPLSITTEVENFFAALKQIGYTGTMSIEGKTDNMEQDAAAALKVLRNLE